MSDINDLSEREREILRLVAGGASNKEIALALTISTNTVKVHLRNIFAKIEVASRTEAAMFAVRSGLVEAGGMPVGSEFASPDSKPFSDEELTNDSGKKVDGKRWILMAAPFVILVIFVLVFISGRSSQPPLETPVSPPVVTSQTRWQEMASMPTGRSGLAVAVFENQIYAIAGEAIGGVTGVVERYDPPKKSWESLQTKPTPVTDVHAAVIGGRIYVPGGRQSDGAITNIMEIYDPRQDTWEQGSPMPVELSAYAMVAFEGKLFVFGGKNERDYLSLVLIYDPAQDIWEEAEPMPTKRAHAGAAVAGGKIFVIGGFDGQKALKESEIFLPGLMNGDEHPWSIGVPLSEGRYKLGVTSLADIIYIFGGVGDSRAPENSFKSLSQNNEWNPIEVEIDHPWASMGLVPIETKLFILGGQINDEPSGSMLEYQAIYTILVPMVP